MFSHRRTCLAWKSRDAEKVRLERTYETWKAQGKVIHDHLCKSCGQRIGTGAHTGENHKDDCPEKPLIIVEGLSGKVQRGHALYLGSEEALQGLVGALARRGPREPDPPTNVSKVVKSEPAGKMFLLTLSCGHLVRRNRQCTQVVCLACGGVYRTREVAQT